MVNRRRPLGVAQENSVATAAQIESFGSAADGNKGMNRVDKSKHLDPQGTRNYKNIRLPFNEFEYARLEHFSAILGDCNDHDSVKYNAFLSISIWKSNLGDHGAAAIARLLSKCDGNRIL